MLYLFFLENIHFALLSFLGLLLLGVCWLYFDAWIVKKNPVGLLKIGGFFLLSLTFFLDAVKIETTIITSTLLQNNLLSNSKVVTCLIGLLLILIGLLLEPLPKKPKNEELESKKLTALMLPGAIATFISFLNPFLLFAVALVILRKAILGLESHLKLLSIVFFLFSIAEGLGVLRNNFLTTLKPDLYNLVKPFGVIWTLQHTILFITSLLLIKWLFSYLLKRIQSQLMIIFTSSLLLVVVLTTLLFTSQLLQNIKIAVSSQLMTNGNVLAYALDAKKESILADIEVLSENPAVIEGLKNPSKINLDSLTESLLLNKNLDSLVITNKNGQVLARGEDKKRVGTSLSDQPLIRKALQGSSIASFGLKNATLAPQITLVSVVPIKSDTQVIGSIMAVSIIDNSIINQLKRQTGLESSIYAQNTLSATSVISLNAGLKEQNTQITDTVLKKGVNYSGETTLANTQYLSVYLPIKDNDTIPIGMISINQTQLALLQTASKSLETTYMLTILLMLLMLLPLILLSRFMERQLR
jgi:hypothetical protein